MTISKVSWYKDSGMVQMKFSENFTSKKMSKSILSILLKFKLIPTISHLYTISEIIPKIVLHYF